MPDSRPEKLKSEIRRSLANSALRSAVARATATTLAKRAAHVAAEPRWEAMRAAAARIKRETVAHLDRYLAQFEAAATAAGIRVHWARDAAEACHHVRALAAAHGVTEVVKSKSMVTEEIGLNAHLERHGIEVVETDLGEFIVQLAGEPPSHLTAPALHKRREDIGRLFAEKLGVAFTDDPVALTALVRERLRGRFLRAGLGITGANFALAREGALVVVENEGNALLTMNLPKRHVVVLGMERLLPSIDELPLFLDLLVVSATGQAFPGYVSVLRGPTPPDRPGPDEVHVVVVDNGRSRMLARPEYRELLHCIRCGACLNVCPVYRQIGGHAYGWVVPGPIGAALIPLVLGLERGRDLPFASTLCGACADICPVKIDLPGHLLRLRGDIAAAGLTGVAERLVVRSWAFAARHPRIYRALTALPRLLGRLPVRAWTATRDMPRPARRSFRRLWDEEERRP
ncbi:MAG: lactate utilization protein [Planctomycetes bacterium]|nr:lactate utilization protein [Planctomycetota bacterium]